MTSYDSLVSSRTFKVHLEDLLHGKVVLCVPLPSGRVHRHQLSPDHSLPMDPFYLCPRLPSPQSSFDPSSILCYRTWGPSPKRIVYGPVVSSLSGQNGDNGDCPSSPFFFSHVLSSLDYTPPDSGPTVLNLPSPTHSGTRFSRNFLPRRILWRPLS